MEHTCPGISHLDSLVARLKKYGLPSRRLQHFLHPASRSSLGKSWGSSCPGDIMAGFPSGGLNGPGGLTPGVWGVCGPVKAIPEGPGAWDRDTAGGLVWVVALVSAELMMMDLWEMGSPEVSPLPVPIMWLFIPGSSPITQEVNQILILSSPSQALSGGGPEIKENGGDKCSISTSSNTCGSDAMECLIDRSMETRNMPTGSKS